jgi:hypothetical protein
VDDGQTVLVFCPIRKSVLPFARSIIEMQERGHIASVLDSPVSALARAQAVGEEWFGAKHDILECLKLGVAVHHGELPTPYRKEVERLLREGVLKVTVSSPTLAQGLNLAATSLVFHGLKRWGENIDVSEFRNVVGRAGRAYIDLEGLVLYPMFDDHAKRRADWKELSSNLKGREMESGLLRLIATLMVRMKKKLASNNMDELLEYVTGQTAWEFPELKTETTEESEAQSEQWRSYLMSLDTAIFSLLGDTPVPDDEIEAKLDDILGSSLFERRLARQKESTRNALRTGLKARAHHIWSNTAATQRRGYFLAGVGLATGKELDAKATELEKLLLRANIAIEMSEHKLAVEAITAFAEIAFLIAPFAPKKLIDNWKEVLKLWLMGQPVTDVLDGDEDGDGDEAISFIEHAFVYNLPWAMEAVRVRAEAHEDPFSNEVKLSDYPRAHAVAASETGTLSVAAATLIQAGFASRLAAIRAVRETGATFDSMSGLMSWLASDQVQALAAKTDWPTSESHKLWLDFVAPGAAHASQPWTVEEYDWPVKWHSAPPPAGTPLRLGGGPGKERAVFTADFREVGRIKWSPNHRALGVTVATASGASDTLDVQYIGPGDLVEL